MFSLVNKNSQEYMGNYVGYCKPPVKQKQDTTKLLCSYIEEL